MKTHMDNVPENCNYCSFRQKVSQHWELEDYCFLNKKKTRDMIMDEDCPLKSLECQTEYCIATSIKECNVWRTI